MAANQLPDAEVLRNLLSYDPATGEFRWLESRGGCYAGSIAGASRNGYLRIGIGGIRFPAHRIAWKMTTGLDPANEIDHINGNKLDNQIANLREANKSQNQHNQGKNAKNTSGVKGVWWINLKGKWRASIKIAGKPQHLGYFTDINDAAAAYAVAAERLYGEFVNLGIDPAPQAGSTSA